MYKSVELSNGYLSMELIGVGIISRNVDVIKNVKMYTSDLINYFVVYEGPIRTRSIIFLLQIDFYPISKRSTCKNGKSACGPLTEMRAAATSASLQSIDWL